MSETSVESSWTREVEITEKLHTRLHSPPPEKTKKKLRQGPFAYFLTPPVPTSPKGREGREGRRGIERGEKKERKTRVRREQKERQRGKKTGEWRRRRERQTGEVWKKDRQTDGQREKEIESGKRPDLNRS